MDDLRSCEGQDEAARNARKALKAIENQAADAAAAAAERMLPRHAERTIVGRMRQPA
jgi:hypothetical protein